MYNSSISTSRRLRGGAALLVFCLALTWPGAAAGQEAGPGEAADSLRAEIADLRARIDSLSRAVNDLREAGAPADETEEEEDALARLRAAAAEAAGGEGQAADTVDRPGAGEEESDFVGRQRSLQALNPEISVNADAFGFVQTDDPDSDNFALRAAEISFQSSLDPYSRAKFFVSHHAHGGGPEPFEGGHGEEGHAEEGHAEEEAGGGLALEEGYMEWVGLPAGVGVKLGKFFQNLGALNRWHEHALAFQSRSLPHIAFVGEEALAQTGASLHWLIPLDLGGTYETWFQVTRAGTGNLFGESEGPSYLGHVNGFWQLGRAWDLDLGVSAVVGDHVEEGHSFGQRLYNVEGALTWRPPARALYRELVVRGGAMILDPQLDPAEVGEEFDDSAWGGWGWLDFKFSRQWHVGGRFEWTQNPADADHTAWLAGPTLTWWQSEWVRLRAEYDYLQRGSENVMSQLLLQVTFAMGPHKHETY